MNSQYLNGITSTGRNHNNRPSGWPPANYHDTLSSAVASMSLNSQNYKGAGSIYQADLERMRLAHNAEPIHTGVMHGVRQSIYPSGGRGGGGRRSLNFDDGTEIYPGSHPRPFSWYDNPGQPMLRNPGGGL